MTRAEHEKICMGFPGVIQDIKWGADLCYCVGEKMFSVTGTEGEFKASLKVDPELFGELTERSGIIPAPYLARYKWILVEDPFALSKKEWKTLLRASYDMVFAKLKKGVQKEINAL